MYPNRNSLSFMCGIVFIMISVLLIEEIPCFAAEIICSDKPNPMQLIPTEDIWNDILIANKYDPEAKAAFDYIGSEAFQKKIRSLEAAKEYHEFIETCKSLNLRIPEIIDYVKTSLPNTLKKIELSNNQTESTSKANPDISNGIHGLLMRIFIKRLPIDEIEKYVEEQEKCDDVFKEKITRLRSAEFKAALLKVFLLKEYEELNEALENYNIFMKVYLNFMLKFLNIDIKG